MCCWPLYVGFSLQQPSVYNTFWPKGDCYAVPQVSVFSTQIGQILHQTCKKEGLSLPAELGKKIAEHSKRNLRKALLICEACRVQQ